MDKKEALQKIEELQKFVEDLDKPKQVRVYIKAGAKEAQPNRWNDTMNHMPGNVFDLKSIDGDGDARVYTDAGHSDYYFFDKENYVIVEGSLEDLN